MTMNQLIHAAVRRDVGRLEAALERANDGDVARASQLERAYTNLHRELQHHHQSEDRLIYPFVAKVEPAPELLKAMDEEHHAMAEALAETRSAMAAYAATASPADAKTARESVARTRAVIDEHLTHEENDFEPLLRPYLDTPEWKTVEKQTVADVGRRDGLLPFVASGRDHRRAPNVPSLDDPTAGRVRVEQGRRSCVPPRCRSSLEGLVRRSGAAAAERKRLKHTRASAQDEGAVEGETCSGPGRQGGLEGP